MAMVGPSTFGLLLRRYRQAAGLTQGELAERARLSERSVSDLERGLRRTPYRATVRQLADALQLVPHDQVAFESAARRSTAAMPLAAPQHRAALCSSNLPDELMPFIGREAELVTICEMLQRPGVRLVSLTGPGGIGKTRLALQAAARLQSQFSDGVYFVPLAAISDPTLVPSAITDAMGIEEQTGRPLLDTLAAFLGSKRLLLVLDNFEHLLPARFAVVEVLDSCRNLRLLVTSRSILNLSREFEYPVPPLSLPGLQNLSNPGTVGKADAVALFIERAQAANPSLGLTAENAAVVAEICLRLDGLPLAIELAAARVRLFPPPALLRRLSHRLPLLTGGAHDRPARHQTLRAAMDWSYNLLSPGERPLFARLSVFAGGCTLDAIDAVCNAQGDLAIDVLDGLASLVEQSLLLQEGKDEPRFFMLETIREYAAEHLKESDEGRRLRQWHAEYYLSMVEEAGRQLYGPEQARWLDRLQGEHDNLRVALAWTRDSGDVETGLRLVSDLIVYWHSRGHYAEGQRWLQKMLTANVPDGQATSPGERVRALNVTRLLAWRMGNAEQTRAVAEDAMRLARETGDRRDLAHGLRSMAWQSREWGEYDRAIALGEESLSLYRELGDRRGIAHTLLTLGDIARDQGDAAAVEAFCREALATYRELGDSLSTAFCLHNLGRAAHMVGNDTRATALCQESLDLLRQLGDADSIADVLASLGLIARDQGDDGEAERLFREGLAVLRPGPLLPLRTARVLEGMAGTAAARHEGVRAARLIGAADAVRARMGAPVMPVDRSLWKRDVEATRKELGELQFTVTWNDGRSMGLEEAMAYALGESAPSTHSQIKLV